jgi:hypothetical protein
MATSKVGETKTPEAQLQSLIGKFEPGDQRLFRSFRSAMRKRFPTANELVYDYRTFIVIGYSPSEHGIESVASVAARVDGVRLYLLNAPELPDPNKLLMGSGKQARFIPLENARQLARPEVEALIAAAIARSRVRLPSRGTGKLFIQTFGGKRRARGKNAK